MMKCIVTFYENAQRVIAESQLTEKKISWAVINTRLEEEFLELSQMKFKDPMTPAEELQVYFDELCETIETKFRNLQHS